MPSTSPRHTNRLARETSPYLLQHAHNPVDWFAWGDEAFEAARREDKPIFLSIGYSTCYWCHVMERQCFENEAIAAVMNASFVNIKVDREERPDIDDVYMAATQLMTRQGGWPMSVWLTHDLKPFYAGTYFPPQPAHGRPSFPQLLESIATAWREHRSEIGEQAEVVAAAVVEHLSADVTPAAVTVDSVQRAAHGLLRGFDPEHGGFSGPQGPKFPTPNHLDFLLTLYRNNPDRDLWDALRLTLDRMARGGLFDQVGGGFHRYSVDEKWLVPHFEKMLYDNAQLVEVYCKAFEQSSSPHERRMYERIVRETCDYVLREMTDASGAFWSAQDAEVDAREGGNYVWTRAQVEEALADEELRELAIAMYALDLGPNFTDPHHEGAEPVNVLFLPTPLEQFGDYDSIARKREAINAALRSVRDRRPQPATDDKVICSWNGMMIAALARAGRTFSVPAYVNAAATAADAILRHMTTPDGGLLRTMRQTAAKTPAFLEDYAFFVHGAVELHRANPNSPWLGVAARYAAEIAARFSHPQGGYFDTLPDRADLFVRTRNTHDGAIPSGNSQHVHNLLDLHALTRENHFLRDALRDLRSFGAKMTEQGGAMAHMAHAALRVIEHGGATALGVTDATSSTVVAGPVSLSIEPSTVSLASGSAEVTLSIDIAEGYHLNGPTATVNGLAALRIELPTDVRHLALSVAYPPATPTRFPYADADVPVYTGRVAVPLTIRKMAAEHVAGPVRLAVSLQACGETSCLAPQQVEIAVEVRD